MMTGIHASNVLGLYPEPALISVSFHSLLLSCLYGSVVQLFKAGPTKMSYNYLSQSRTGTRHKVFISYYHDADQYYRNYFEDLFGHLFIGKSVKPGDIDTDVSTEYIKRLIQQGYISDTSVIVVLIGANTWGRKHVDWEISAALSKKIGGYSGLLGLWLPTHPDYGRDKYKSDIVPPRLVDNLKTGYAKLYDWTTIETSIKKWVEDAFQARITRADRIDNSRLQFGYNRS